MKKNLLRLTSLFLVVFMLLPLVIACNKEEEGGEETTVTTAAAGDAETFRDDLPELDFDGELVTFVSRQSGDYEKEVTVLADDTDEIVNEAVYNREKEVENRLNIDLVNIQLPDGETEGESLYRIVNAIKMDIQAGTNEYDIGVSNATQFYANVADNIAYDLYTVPYIDTDKPYYAKYQIEKSELNGSLYAITGDASTTLIKKSLVTYFNKKLVNELKIPDLYTTVLDGDWTFDYQKELATMLFESTDDIADETDTYGFVTDSREGVDAYLSGWELQLLGRDNDGKFVVSVDRNKMQTALTRINEAYYQTTGIFATSFPKHGDAYSLKINMFAQDQAMFATLKLGTCEDDAIRMMESEYGIIPIPKYDKSQTDYYTNVEDIYSVYFISSAVPEDRLKLVGATLECFFSESDQVRYNLFEVALKVKYQSDAVTGQMLDIIINNVNIDSGWIYNYCANGIGAMLRKLVEAESNDFASTYRTAATGANKYLGKFYEKLANNGM